MSKFTVVNHPLIAHKLSLMRQTETSTKDFRTLLEEISLLMGYEVTRDLPSTLSQVGELKTKSTLRERSMLATTLLPLWQPPTMVNHMPLSL